jgi:hypothetical protein
MNNSSRFRFHVAVIISCSSLFLINCGSEDDSAPNCGAGAGGSSTGNAGAGGSVTATPPFYVTCRDDGECQDSPYFPACGDYNNVTCFKPDPTDPSLNECLYRIIDDENCPCLERDMRLCDLQPGTGIQYCERPDPNQLRTVWGSCGAN